VSEQAQARLDELSLCCAVFAIKVIVEAVITGHSFSLKDLWLGLIFCRAVFFIFISWNI